MKKTVFFLFILLFTADIYPSVDVKWMPQAGMLFTWDESPLAGRLNRYYPGYFAGASAEINFTTLFSIKSGLNIAFPVYTQQQKIADPDNDDFTPVDILHTNTISCLELPVLAGIFLGDPGSFGFYAGAGLMNFIRISHTLISEDRDTGAVYDETTVGTAWYTAWMIDAGLRIKAEPGQITLGASFSSGEMEGFLTGEATMIRIYGGYFF